MTYDYNHNIYYNPEKHGLTVVAEIEYSSGEYEFDTRVVWRDASGKLYTARDSGCSCPTPFEEVTMQEADSFSYDAIHSEVMNEDHYGYVSEEQKQEFLRDVRAAMTNYNGG